MTYLLMGHSAPKGLSAESAKQGEETTPKAYPPRPSQPEPSSIKFLLQIIYLALSRNIWAKFQAKFKNVLFWLLTTSVFAKSPCCLLCTGQSGSISCTVIVLLVSLSRKKVWDDFKRVHVRNHWMFIATFLREPTTLHKLHPRSNLMQKKLEQTQVSVLQSNKCPVGWIVVQVILCFSMIGRPWKGMD